MTFWQEIKERKWGLFCAPFKTGVQAIPLNPYFAGFAGLSVLMLSAAFFLQYVGGYAPCAFCIFERWPYVVAALAALGGLFLSQCRPKNFMLLLIVLSYLTNVGLSGYHVAIEHKWVALPKVCGSHLNAQDLSFDQLKEKLLNTKKIVPCDQVPLKVFGFSLVEYNLVFTFLVFLFAALLLRKRAQVCYMDFKNKKVG